MINKFRGYNVFYVNDYPCIWNPDHELAVGDGYVYIHRIIAKEEFDEFSQDKVVHHKDGNKDNWSVDNLELIMSQSDHGRKHSHEFVANLPNDVEKPNNPVERYCCNEECDKTVKVRKTSKIKQDKIYCCHECCNKDREKTNWPDNEDLLKKLEEESFVAVAEELGVSDNAIRNRLEARDLL